MTEPSFSHLPAGVRLCAGADPAAVAQTLALRVAHALGQGLAARGRASLWVSGGSTPLPFFEALSRQPLEWARVRVGLVDERWCAPTEADSNARLVHAHLLQREAAVASWQGLYRPHVASPHAAQGEVNKALSTCAWPADVVVLGLGGDGHTASWFPETPEYRQALHPAPEPRGVAVSAPAFPNVPRPRFTLTLGAVRDTRLICLHFTGQAKAELLARIWAGEQAPIGAIWSTPSPKGQSRPPLEVHWSP